MQPLGEIDFVSLFLCDKQKFRKSLKISIRNHIFSFGYTEMFKNSHRSQGIPATWAASFFHIKMSLTRVFCLKEFTSGEQETDKDHSIKDPYGGSLEVYRNCYYELKYQNLKLLERLVDYIGNQG